MENEHFIYVLHQFIKMQGKCIREKGANVYESVCAFKQLLAFANKQMRPYVSVILAKRNDNNDEMMTMMATTTTMITTVRQPTK